MWATADVQFERLINGIPFLDSCIRVSVDAAGHVVDCTDAGPETTAGVIGSETDY